MTTNQEQPEKKSYTTRMIEFLTENKVNKKTIQLIQEFGKSESVRMEESRNATQGQFTWGKFKGKDIKDIFAIDKQYCQWALKSNYLRDDQKELIQKLLSE